MIYLYDEFFEIKYNEKEDFINNVIGFMFCVCVGYENTHLLTMIKKLGKGNVFFL